MFILLTVYKFIIKSLLRRLHNYREFPHYSLFCTMILYINMEDNTKMVVRQLGEKLSQYAQNEAPVSGGSDTKEDPALNTSVNLHCVSAVYGSQGGRQATRLS